MLSGHVKKPDDVRNPSLRHFPRFAPENFDHNFALVKQVEALAEKKGCTPAQLAVSWTRNLSKKPGMPTIIPIPGATTVARVVENAKLVDLSLEDLGEIDATLAKFEIKGDRSLAYVPTDT